MPERNHGFDPKRRALELGLLAVRIEELAMEVPDESLCQDLFTLKYKIEGLIQRFWAMEQTGVDCELDKPIKEGSGGSGNS